MSSNLEWFAVEVEDKNTGILAIHYVQAVFPSSAKEVEEAAGYNVLSVQRWNK